MSAKKFRLTVQTTEREDGYDWNIVECPECGESVQQRNIEDEGRAWMDDYRENVCPACDQAMQIEDDDESGIVMPSVQSVGYSDNGGDDACDAA